MHTHILYEHIAGQCGYLLGICGRFYLIELNINLLMHITNQHIQRLHTKPIGDWVWKT